MNDTYTVPLCQRCDRHRKLATNGLCESCCTYFYACKKQLAGEDDLTIEQFIARHPARRPRRKVSPPHPQSVSQLTPCWFCKQKTNLTQVGLCNQCYQHYRPFRGDLSVEEFTKTYAQYKPVEFTPGFLITDECMKDLCGMITRVAPSDVSVLITGETGSGKECVAQAIHMLSKRKPFVTVDCTTLTPTLIENELFGHAPYAFTGGGNIAKHGLLAEADRGTLFLDEISELPLEMQGKLLRFLETLSFRPVGSHTYTEIDTRIIAATNVDLKTLVARGTFRRDLYYRLNVFPLTVPPLRDRPGDIDALTAKFLGKTNLRLSTSARVRLHAHSWPGNVRELKHVIRRATILATTETIEPEQIVYESF